MLTQKKFVTACRDFFGLHDGQKLKEFADELKTLSSNDRDYFKEEFRKVGIEIIEA